MKFDLKQCKKKISWGDMPPDPTRFGTPSPSPPAQNHLPPLNHDWIDPEDLEFVRSAGGEWGAEPKVLNTCIGALAIAQPISHITWCTSWSVFPVEVCLHALLRPPRKTGKRALEVEGRLFPGIGMQTSVNTRWNETFLIWKPVYTCGLTVAS